MPAKILVVAAHPDDEVLGCGATIARRASAGETVWTLILGEGVTSRRGLSRPEKSRLLKKLGGDSRRAAKILGVSRHILKSFPDNAFDSIPRLGLIHAVEELVAELKPSTIYTHSPADLNVDHQLVCEAVKTACRPLPGCPVKEILAFEIPSSTEWRFDAGRAFHPDVFTEISGQLDLKIRALQAYTGETRAFPHPRSEEYIRALAAVRGGQAGLRAAEAFSLIRRIEG